MLRNLDIPSRLVNGIAKGKDNFDFHNWIEVYFPNAGWVPFDATHAQFGIIDKYHIKLFHHHKHHAAVRSHWKYYPHFGDVKIKSKDFSTVEVKEHYTEENVFNPFDLKIQTVNGKLNTLSHVPIMISYTNNTPHYFSNKIQLNHDESVKLTRNKHDLMSFKPFETKKLGLSIRLNNSLKNKGQTVNIFVYDLYGAKQEVKLYFSPTGKIINRRQVGEIINTWKKL